MGTTILNLIKIFLSIVFVGIENFAESSINAVNGKSMANSNAVEYSVLYANPQRNSYTNAAMVCIGVRAWKKTYKPEFDKRVVAPVAVLACGNTIGVQVSPYFLLYRDGVLIKDHWVKESSKEIGVFLDGKYAVVKNHGSFENYYSYSGKVIPSEEINGFIDEWWYLKLITPYKNGLILAKQFTGGPTRSPKEFKICFYVPNHTGKFVGGKGVIDNVLISSTGDKLLFTQKEIHVVNPATGDKIKTFDSELLSIFSASLDLSDNLMIHGMNKDQKEVISSFNLDGTQQWEHIIEGSIQNSQPPVCGENGVSFFISDSSLFCINADTVLWKELLFPCAEPLITVCKGNTVIVQSGLHIMTYSAEGKKLFSTLITKNTSEEFTAPPVIGSDGRIYIASAKALYCFK